MSSESLELSLSEPPPEPPLGGVGNSTGPDVAASLGGYSNVGGPPGLRVGVGVGVEDGNLRGSGPTVGLFDDAEPDAPADDDGVGVPLAGVAEPDAVAVADGVEVLAGFGASVPLEPAEPPGVTSFACAQPTDPTMMTAAVTNHTRGSNFRTFTLMTGNAKTCRRPDGFSDMPRPEWHDRRRVLPLEHA